MGVIAINPTKVGIKKAKRNNILSFGSLNFVTNRLLYLKVKMTNERNTTGITKKFSKR